VRLDSEAKVYVAGHRGMVGSAVQRALVRRGVTTIGRTSEQLDLRQREEVRAFVAGERPTHVVMAAARVGGILANATEPATFLSDNLRLQVNVLDAAVEFGVSRLLFLGSSCVYPKFAPQPIPEEALLTGPLEPTNDAYAIAKIAGLLHVQALRRQHGVSYISVMPTNLYGPEDNFSLDKSHVLPALIRKLHDAKATGASSVVVWGTGAPRREFLHVDDLAEACLFLLDSYDQPEPVNVGVGADLSIRDLVEIVRDVVGFEGEVVWDTSKPDGTPQKLLDVRRLSALGWRPQVELKDGIEDTYAWFLDRLRTGQARL
jgi:GDP-L-fucose synthase